MPGSRLLLLLFYHYYYASKAIWLLKRTLPKGCNLYTYVHISLILGLKYGFVKEDYGLDCFVANNENTKCSSQRHKFNSIKI